MVSAPARVRVGLLGTGAIAQVVHMPILTQLPGVSLHGVADANLDKARAIGGRFEVPHVFEDDDGVFSSDEIDAVVLCTPSHQHEAQAIAALEAGKHVLVERPLALDARGAERVIEAAERAGKVLMVALSNRFRADMRALRPFVHGGELGDLVLLRAAWLNRKTRTVRPTWRHKLATAGGGALMDLGTQVLDLCLWTLGSPRIVRVTAHIHPGEGMEVEDTASVMLWTEAGGVISLDVSWSLLAERDHRTFEILGTHGSASVSPLTVHKEVEHGLLDVTPYFPRATENLYTASYRGQLMRFIEGVRAERGVELPTEQIEVMRLIELAYRSAEEGRALEV